MRGAIHQLAVQSRQRPGVPGMPVDVSQGNDYDLLINKNPQAAELYTLVIDTADNSTLYSVDLADPAVTVGFTSDASATKAEVADGFAAAWNVSPLARAMAVALSDGTDTITYTGVFPGVAFVMTENANAASMTLTNTTDAAEAAVVPFGRAMVSLAFESSEPDELGILAASSALSARVSTLTVTYAATDIYTVGLTIGGRRYEINVLADTNDDTTAAAINTAINAMMPAVTVIGTVATNVVTLTAELAGKFFEIDLGLKSGTTARLVLADTTNTPSCDFNQVFAGISQYTYDTELTVLPASSSADDVVYAANAGVTAMTRGQMWVEIASGTTITSKSPVYVELDGTGTAAGRFYPATSATRVLVDTSKLRWRRAAHSDSDANVAALAIDLAA